MGKDPVFRKSHTSDLKFLLKVYTNKCTKLDWFTYVIIINHKKNKNNLDNLNHLYQFYWMFLGFQYLGLFLSLNLAYNPKNLSSNYLILFYIAVNFWLF